MTDDELLKRLEETPPDEWTLEELEQLRARAKENAALREALADYLSLEQALTTSLSAGRITAAQVLARLERRRALPISARWWAAAAIACLIVGVGGVWYLRSRNDGGPLIVRRPDKPTVEPTPLNRLPHVKPTAAPVGTPPQPAPSATAAPPAATAVATSVPAPAAGADEPWTDMLAAAPRPFDEWCFGERRLSRESLALGRWWNTITGQQRPTGADDRFGLQMAGLFQLRSPWPADATLTLWLRDQPNEILKLHLWHGAEGVSLEFRTRPYSQVTAYRTTKRAGEPTPRSYAFATGDNDRARRTGEGPLDLRFHAGRLYVSRGDVLLFSAAMPAVPDAVYLEGRTLLKAVGLTKVDALPKRWLDEAAADRFPSPFETIEPIAWPPLAATAWKTELPAGASFERFGDAGGTLSARDTTKPAFASIPLAKFGLYDVTFEVERADAGTGIYLGDADGRARYAIGFHEDRPGEPLHVGIGRPTDAKPRYKHDPRQGPAPAIAFPAKLRIVCGAGIVKIYASADGRSWGRIIDPIRGIDGVHPTAGLFCTPGKGARSITLQRVRTAPLTAADPQLVERVPPLPEPGGLAKWYLDVSARPTELPPLRQCAAALLARGVRYDVARILLDGIGAPEAPGEQAGGSSFAAECRSLDTACRAADTWDAATAETWLTKYVELAELRPDAVFPDVPAESADASKYSRVRRALMEAPIASAGRLPTMPADLIREEILTLYRDGRWTELDRLCRVLHFFGGREDPTERRPPPREPIMTLVDWAAAHAERRRPVPEGALPAAPQTALKSEWRHPLIEQFGKEGYNVLAELETALEEKAYVDACRIITSVTAVQAVGLLPNAGDSDLLVSLPGAVALAMRDHPELRAVMQREHGDLAQLRLRQATAEGDVAAVQALTTQFFGTTAAAQAQMWLGDRALAQGDAARAEGCYQAARSELPEGDLTPIDARLRLAAAMQGRNFGDPPAASIAFGELTLSPAEFERTVAQLRARAPAVEIGPRSATGAPSESTVSPLPPPGRYALKPFAKLEGEVGRNPEQVPQRDVDYVGAQISVAFAGGRMIVGNRFQTAAYALADGKLAWRTGLGGEQGRAYQWPLVPMPPVVADDRLFVRRLLPAGPELACLNLDDGRIVWRSPRGEIVASDPLVAVDRVSAVTLTTPQTDVVEAALTTFDLRTGKVLRRRPLMQLRDYWKREIPCHLVAAGDMLVASLGGCVVGVEGEGEPRWLRRLTWIPPSVDGAIGPAYPVVPRFVDGALAVAQPGAAFLYHLDPRTGVVRDRRPIARPTPAIEGLVVPETRRLTHGYETFAVDDAVVERRWYRSRMNWFGDTTGYASTSWPAPWQKQRGAIGPITAVDGRAFAFTAADVRSPTREIVELVFGETILPEATDVAFGADELAEKWGTTVPPPLARLSQAAAPWSLLQSRYDERLWFDNKLFLADDCRLTLAAAEAPAVWTRRVSLPKLNPKRLRLRVAAASAEPWQLTVRADDKTVLERTIEPAVAADGKTIDPQKAWRTETVDLEGFAGRDVRLSLISSVVPSKTNKPALAAWQTMEIVDR